MRRTSSGSVTISWLDREALLDGIRAAVKHLVAARPEVLTVVLFGSAANGRAVPGSDADLLLVVRECTVRPLDRPLLYGPWFEGLGVGVDLFVSTEQEIASHPPRVAEVALATGTTLFSRREAP